VVEPPDVGPCGLPVGKEGKLKGLPVSGARVVPEADLVVLCRPRGPWDVDLCCGKLGILVGMLKGFPVTGAFVDCAAGALVVVGAGG